MVEAMVYPTFFGITRFGDGDGRNTKETDAKDVK